MKFRDLHNEATSYLKNNFWKLLSIIILESFVVGIFSALANKFENPLIQLILQIAIYIISLPLSYGVIVSFMKASHNESFSLFDFFHDGMSSFKRVWAVFGRTIQKLILPLLLVILVSVGCSIASIFMNFSTNINYDGESGSFVTPILRLVLAILPIAASIYYIVKSLLYSLTSYILYDNPDLTGKEIVEESATMMKGNRSKFFCYSMYIALLVVLITLIAISIPFFAYSLSSLILSLIIFIIGIFAILPYAFAIQIAFYNLLKKNENGNVVDTKE